MPKRGGDKEASQIADLVETIRKKKGFKQLVTYNIQLLEKAVAPTKDRCVGLCVHCSVGDMICVQ